MDVDNCPKSPVSVDNLHSAKRLGGPGARFSEQEAMQPFGES